MSRNGHTLLNSWSHLLKLYFLCSVDSVMEYFGVNFTNAVSNYTTAELEKYYTFDCFNSIPFFTFVWSKSKFFIKIKKDFMKYLATTLKDARMMHALMQVLILPCLFLFM